MSDQPYSTLPERNPETHEAHRREVLWQVMVPLIVGVLVLLALAVLSATGGTEQVSRWGDVSLIWLILPMLLVALIFLVITAGLAYGVIWLVRVLPGYARQLQALFETLAVKVKQVSDLAAEPFIRIHSFMAGMQVLFNRKK
ncbi:MAG: hypothetical protein P8074_14145 [Anaerolineales bacterium]|jgi:hypothetical protein